MLKKILTFKSGQFIFSSDYSKEKLFELQLESSILFKTVRDLPVLPKIASQLQEDLIKRSIFSTAAIEGNPLSEERVSEIIDGKENIQNTEKSTMEIKNLTTVYDLIRVLDKKTDIPYISEDLIKKLHLFITDKIEYDGNKPGNYRNHLVKVGNTEHGGIFTPPKIMKDIQKLMIEFVEWINSKEICELNPIVRAALAHYHLALIHPFGDGNGRTARILEAYLLRLSDIKYVPTMLSNFYYKKMDDYYWAFSKSIKDENHSITPFLEFVLVGVVESLNEIKERITYHIRVLALKDYYHFLRQDKKLTQRQYDLLMNMLEKPFPIITLKELYQKAPFDILYRKVSSSSARRDLKKLIEHNIFSINEKGEYFINYRALD